MPKLRSAQDGDERMGTRAIRGIARRPRLVEGVGVAVGSIFSAIAFTWPLVLHLQTRARDQFDAVFQAWTIDWVQYAVQHGRNLYDAPIFVPEKTTLAYSDTLMGVAIPTLPLRWLGMSPIGVLNVSLLLAFASSAAAAYLFVRLVTGSRVAAAVGGAGYAFGPFGALAARHLHVAMRPGVPLAAAAAWWLAERARTGGRLVGPAATLVAVIAWQATVSFYPATYAVVAAIVVLAVRLRSLGRRGLVAAGGSLAAAGGVCLLLAIPNIVVAARHPSYQRPLAEFGPLGANFARVEPGLVVWGGVLRHNPSDIPSAAFPGATLLAVALVGAVVGWRVGGRFRTAAMIGLALTGVGAIVAVGTAANGWRQYAPYRLLFVMGPPFNALRDTARGWMIGLCGLGLLAGIGAHALVAWIRPRVKAPSVVVPAVVGAVLVALVLLEGYDPWDDRPSVRVPAVDVALARRSGSGGVVYLPMAPTDRASLAIFTQPSNLYGETQHHRPTLNGYSGYVPPSYPKLSRALWSLPSSRALTLLRKLGIRYVVVHPSVGGGPWSRLLSPSAAAPLRHLGVFENDQLYEVPAS